MDLCVSRTVSWRAAPVVPGARDRQNQNIPTLKQNSSDITQINAMKTNIFGARDKIHSIMGGKPILQTRPGHGGWEERSLMSIYM